MQIGSILWNIIEAITRFFLLKIFRLKLNEGQIQSFLQFVRFGLVGAFNTITGLLIYGGSLRLFQALALFPRFDYQLANLIQFVVTVFLSFVLNSLFVFKKSESETRNPWKVLLRTYAAYAFTGIFLNTIMGFVWVDIIGLPKMVSALINVIINVPINFFINKLWAFRTKKADA